MAVLATLMPMANATVERIRHKPTPKATVEATASVEYSAPEEEPPGVLVVVVVAAWSAEEAPFA